MARYKNDPGHGGTDPGAVAKGNIEKNYTLEAGLYVDKRLKEHGITSDMTRTTDVTLTNAQRTANVRNSGAKYCFSHHFNAGGGSGAEFIHSIFSDGKMANTVADEFRKAGYPLRPKTVFSKPGSNGKDYYYMNRETGAVDTTIIEYDFVDGPQSEKIKDKNYRIGMYECVVRAVCRVENVAYKPLVQPTQPKEETEMEKRAIVINSSADYANAEPLANRLQCGIFPRAVAQSRQVAEQIIVCGGTKDGLKGSNFVVLSGADRYATAENIRNFKG